MKIPTVFAICVLVALCSAPAVPAAGIKGSAHDFGIDDLASESDLCAVCHVPRKTDLAAPLVPLWDTRASSPFTLYGATRPAVDAPGRSSSASSHCLACHDGIIATDIRHGRMGTSTNRPDAHNQNGSHPVGIIYDARLASQNPSLYDPTARSSGLGGTIDKDLLFDSRLECSSCHDVHAKKGHSVLLRMANARSALCLTCHNK